PFAGAPVSRLLFQRPAASDRRLRHRLGLKGLASWQIDPIARLRTPCRRPPPQSAGDPPAGGRRGRFFVPRSRGRPAAAAAWRNLNRVPTFLAPNQPARPSTPPPARALVPSARSRRRVAALDRLPRGGGSRRDR